MNEEKKKLPQSVIDYIDDCIKKPRAKSYLISVLQKVQETFGYLPRECMDEVSERMQIPSARVTGVATFYHFFRFLPKAKTCITVCMGTACFVRGAEQVMDKIKELLEIDEHGMSRDGQFSLEPARCLGACALAPVVVINDRVYGNVKPADVPAMLAEYGYQEMKK